MPKLADLYVEVHTNFSEGSLQDQLSKEAGGTKLPIDTVLEGVAGGGKGGGVGSLATMGATMGAVAGGVMALVDIGKKGLDMAISSSKIITGTLSTIADFMGILMDTTILLVVGVVGSLLPVIIPVIEKVGESMIPIAESMYEWTMGTFAPYMENLYTMRWEFMIGAIESISGLVSEIGPSAHGLLVDVVDIAMQLSTFVESVYYQVLGPVIRIVSNYLGNILPPVMDLISTILDDTVSPWIETIGGLIELHLMPIMENYIEPILIELGDIVGNIMEPVLSGIGILIVGISEFLLAIVEPILEGVFSVLGVLLPPIFEVIMYNLRGINEAISFMAEQAGYVKESWDDASNSIVSAIVELGEDIAGQEAERTDWDRTWVEEGFDEITGQDKSEAAKAGEAAAKEETVGRTQEKTDIGEFAKRIWGRFTDEWNEDQQDGEAGDYD